MKFNIKPRHFLSKEDLVRLRNKRKKTAIYTAVILLIASLIIMPMFGEKINSCFAPKKFDFKSAFLTLADAIHDKKNGYISKEDIPYHSVEKFIVEAVDYGKHSTSEAMGALLWMDTLYAQVTKDWTRFKKDWDVIDNFYIPSPKEQPYIDVYLPFYPSNFIPNDNNPYHYPKKPSDYDSSGQDPIAEELIAKYGDKGIYLMHWYLDVENWMGFGDKTARAVKIKLYERGAEESTWETIPHPCYDEYGNGEFGFADLYVDAASPQWRYASAPDAELRIAQAMYWAKKFADNQNISIKKYTDKTLKMGDFLRYSLYDKYFQAIGKGKTPAEGIDSCHYLVSWLTSWGGGINHDWSWRMGFNQIHTGYQNPMGAYTLALNGQKDWAKSLHRQMELINWVQSKEGPIGGGVINDYSRQNGSFYGMFYDQHPVFNDPPSNTWAGWQYFLMERVAQYYYESGDQLAEKILDKWCNWMVANIKFKKNDEVKIPGELFWKGSPETDDLTCEIKGYTQDVGGMALASMVLTFWDKGKQKWAAKETGSYKVAQKILTKTWKKYFDGIGVAPPETRSDYARYWSQTVPMTNKPKTMPWGKQITKKSVYADTRPSYGEKLPPKGPYSKNNPAPTYKYHRTWHQTHFAMALGYMHMFEDTPEVLDKGIYPMLSANTNL